MLALIKQRQTTIITIIVTVIVILLVIKSRSANNIETISPITGDWVQTVKVSGKLVPEESVNLGFEVSGTIINVAKDTGQLVKRGDLVAQIDTSGIAANISKAEAELSLAQAELGKLEGAGAYETQIENAKRVVIQTIIDGYTTTNDAVYNKTDQFFLNPRSDRPELIPNTNNSRDLRDSIIRQRINMTEILNAWKVLIDKIRISAYSEENFLKSKQYFTEVFSYISDISQIANFFESDSYLSQSDIDAYRSAASTAKDKMNSASQNLLSAEDKLRGLLLDVPIQVARVESARASLLNYRSQLSKSYIISPIEGVISKQEAKIGQVVSTNENIVSIISKELEIEAFIPEVLISDVRVGNSASVTLDAYGDSENFKAQITQIDPAETIRDGVSTYKIKLVFESPDERIRSGMTANITIEVLRKNDVILIPERAIIRENDDTFIYVLSENEERKVPVAVSKKDSSGNVELISELPENTQLIINPTTN